MAIPPAILYKYCPPERIDIFEGVSIRFSPPGEFNDTFDSHYQVPSIPKSEKRSLLSPQVKERNKFLKDVGILCLTEQFNHPVMWATYAASHTGFVIGFDSSSDFFKDDGRRLDRVDYVPNPPVFPEPSLEVCYRKSDVWKYEQEWRCVQTFDSADRLVFIDPSSIKEIVIGTNMKEYEIARLASALEAIGLTEVVQVFRSRTRHQEWQYIRERIILKPCQHCRGTGCEEWKLD